MPQHFIRRPRVGNPLGSMRLLGPPRRTTPLPLTGAHRVDIPAAWDSLPVPRDRPHSRISIPEATIADRPPSLSYRSWATPERAARAETTRRPQPWRCIYQRIGDVFIIAAIAPEAQKDKAGFERAVAAAKTRLAEIEP
jgi:hypothetical protein